MSRILDASGGGGDKSKERERRERELDESRREPFRESERGYPRKSYDETIQRRDPPTKKDKNE